jgi:hypothetical protein
MAAAVAAAETDRPAAETRFDDLVMQGALRKFSGDQVGGQPLGRRADEAGRRQRARTQTMVHEEGPAAGEDEATVGSRDRDDEGSLGGTGEEGMSDQTPAGETGGEEEEPVEEEFVFIDEAQVRAHFERVKVRARRGEGGFG